MWASGHIRPWGRVMDSPALNYQLIPYNILYEILSQHNTKGAVSINPITVELHAMEN